jgi:hypothetical protein
MKRLLAVVAFAAAVVFGIDVLGDLTQSRPDAPNVSADTEVVVAVAERGFNGDVDSAAAALWAVCAGLTTSQPVDGGALEPLGGSRYRVVLRPAVGDGERRKLVGCLEDFTVARVRADVRSFREVATRSMPDA